MKHYLILITVAIFLYSCNLKIDPETYSQYQKRGGEISNLAQSVLLANVGQAIQKGGPVYAVEFCNLQASAIIDSLNTANNCVISRVSEKNRNTSNNLKTSSDKNLWALFAAGTTKDTIVQENKKLIYYKPIKIALPACLKCHGETGSDIDPATSEKLQNLYPADLATGYKLNDFRGLWKVEFSTE